MPFYRQESRPKRLNYLPQVTELVKVNGARIGIQFFLNATAPHFENKMYVWHVTTVTALRSRIVPLRL